MRAPVIGAIGFAGRDRYLHRCKPAILIVEEPSKRLVGSMEPIDIFSGILQSYGYREGMNVGADWIYLCD